MWNKINHIVLKINNKNYDIVNEIVLSLIKLFIYKCIMS